MVVGSAEADENVNGRLEVKAGREGRILREPNVLAVASSWSSHEKGDDMRRTEEVVMGVQRGSRMMPCATGTQGKAAWVWRASMRA
jgi:hypothetical protein